MSQVKTKSWTPYEGAVDSWEGSGIFSLPKPKFGLCIFLSFATVLFLLLLVSYFVRMQVADWQPLREPLLLWFNTGVLILSSLALQRAKIAADNGRIQTVRSSFLVGGVLAGAFLAGQLLAWNQLQGLGYYLSRNPANSFFYLMTTLHALHLLGGMVAWRRASTKLSRGIKLDQVRLSVELCAIYWHFLLLVWLLMFGLMLLS